MKEERSQLKRSGGNKYLIMIIKMANLNEAVKETDTSNQLGRTDEKGEISA